MERAISMFKALATPSTYKYRAHRDLDGDGIISLFDSRWREWKDGEAPDACGHGVYSERPLE